MRRFGLAALLLLAGAAAAPAQEAPPAEAAARIGVRVGTHPGFGRVVFDTPGTLEYRVEQVGDRLRLVFTSPAAIDASRAARPPRNVAAVAATPDGAEVYLAPGARARVYRLGSRIVVDVSDPVRGATPAAVPAGADLAGAGSAGAEPAGAGSPAARPAAEAAPLPPRVRRPVRAAAPPGRQVAPEPPAAATPAPAPQSAPLPAVQSAPISAPAPAAEPASGQAAEPALAPASSPPPPATPPRATVAEAVPARPLAGGRGVALPVGEEVGAAVLRRGDAVLVVFDAVRSLDLAALRGHPAFAGAEAWTTSAATVLRLPLAAPGGVVARRDGASWVLVAAEGAPAHGRSVLPEPDPGPPARLALRAARPGRTVAIADPETGGPLLIGTVLEAGQAVPVARRLPELDLLPTMLGIALLARDDRVALRPGADRFTLSVAGGLASAAAFARDPGVEASAMSRGMDLVAAPVPALLERLRAQYAEVAVAPPLARGALRRDAAETLLALGMPQEAQAVAALAMAEDPRAAADPRLILVHGAAALLAGRLTEARSLDDPRLPESDEVALWRGALAATRGEPPPAAARLAVTLPLLLAYPEGTRARLAPIVGEGLVEAQELLAARRLAEALPRDPGLAMTRARIAEAEGRAEEALAGYEAIARGRDRLARARALRRGIELRLAAGELDAGGAAAALEAGLYAWRGDAVEFGARLRLAELRRAAGEPRTALTVLRETERLYPERAAELRAPIAEAFAHALAAELPVTAVALFDATPELLPEGAAGEALVSALAGRLAALDLPERAARLLNEAIARTPDAAARAGLGVRLAALRLEANDPGGALEALAATETPSLPPPLVAERALAGARALARRGDREAAVATLRGLGAAGAAPLAELLAEQQDWTGAAAALGEHLAATLPHAPAALDDGARRAVTRLAALAALGSDDARLAALRAAYLERMGQGPFGDLFDLLTSDPLRGLADLPRLQRELDLLRAVPGRLEALRMGAVLAR